MAKYKKILLFAAVAAGMLALTACRSSGQKGGSDGGNDGSSASGTVQDVSGTQDVSGVQVDGSSAASTGTAAGTDAGTDEAPEAGTPVEDGGPSGDVIPDDDADAAEAEGDFDDDGAASEDGWTGTYIGDEGTVTITGATESDITFVFAQSGISGSAVLNGSQAVYKGDDHYVIVFNLAGDILDVSVSNEEDYDASESPLIGTYVKEQ